MEGIRIVSEDDLTVAVVTDISDELFEHLRRNLHTFCYGASLVEEEPDFYSFEETIRQLLERFDTKSKTVQVGMAGELLVHLLIPSCGNDLTSGAVFFNKEERNIKKGFDLTFLATDQQSVWYCEVKSGEALAGSADEKAHSLLLNAARDIDDKLSAGATRSRWDSAIIDAGLTLASEAAFSMKKLLRRDSATHSGGAPDKSKVVLSGIVFHDYLHCEISPSAIRATALKIKETNRFADLRVIVAQQDAFLQLIDHLRKELQDA